MYNYNYDYSEDYLMHHGVKGMKWGVRRRSQAVVDARAAYKSASKDYTKAYNKAHNKAFAAYSPIKKHRQANDARWNDAYDKAQKLNKAKDDYKQAKRDDKAANKAAKNTPEAITERKAKQKEALKIGAAVAGTALASYGVYKVSQVIKDKNFKHAMDKGMKVLDASASRGRFDDGMEQLKDIMDTHYNAKVSDIVKRNIANNSVNGKVDWKAIRDIYK